LISSTFQHVRYFQLSTLQDYNIFNISAFNSSTFHHFKHLNSGASKLSSILVPGVVDRWAVDRWWHKYCLYSFPMKVKTRNAFKRSQGLQSPEAPKGCVCVRTRVTRHAAWSHGRDTCDCAQIMVERKRMFQISNRPPKPETLPKNKKSYAAAVPQDSMAEARQCKLSK
jgi:hypothetical protein